MSDPSVKTIEPTQVKHPLVASVRTFIQTFIPGLLVALVVLPAIIEAVLDEPNLPPGLRAGLVTVTTLLAIVAGILARIMAIPSVNRWLLTIGVGAPKVKVLDKTPSDVDVRVTDAGNVVVEPQDGP